MNHLLQSLQPYPFERLRTLKDAVTPSTDLPHIALSIGEPKHAAPLFVRDALTDAMDDLEVYPTTAGVPELRHVIARWLEQRFDLPKVDGMRHVLPVCGTREAIFSFVQAAFDRSQADTRPYVMTPNPFYQIYEGATLLAGGQTYLLNCEAKNGFNPDFTTISDEDWQKTQILFLCSPGNPTGAVIPLDTLTWLLEKAEQHDFIIASDECYSEIYFTENERPTGLLEACKARGDHEFKRAVVFHSLSKRSNLPGMRSGFIAGDAELLTPYLNYRTYHGSALPLQVQKASMAAWQDETHVEHNRSAYREKFRRVLDILGTKLEVAMPDAGFYLWARTPIADTDFAQQLYAQQNVTVLPGSYLGREAQGVNPGSHYIRMALVATLPECIEAAERIARFVDQLNND
ncbi:MAG: succinyldiaminopimelate transaminase [Natronospirillum sp.]